MRLRWIVLLLLYNSSPILASQQSDFLRSTAYNRSLLFPTAVGFVIGSSITLVHQWWQARADEARDEAWRMDHKHMRGKKSKKKEHPYNVLLDGADDDVGQLFDVELQAPSNTAQQVKDAHHEKTELNRRLAEESAVINKAVEAKSPRSPKTRVIGKLALKLGEARQKLIALQAHQDEHGVGAGLEYLRDSRVAANTRTSPRRQSDPVTRAGMASLSIQLHAERQPASGDTR